MGKLGRSTRVQVRNRYSLASALTGAGDRIRARPTTRTRLSTSRRRSPASTCSVSDPGLGALVEGLPRAVIDRLSAHGEAVGSRRDASSSAGSPTSRPPVLRTHDASGTRIDIVEFHPAYHALMRRSVAAGLHCLGLGRGRAPRRACGASPAPPRFYMTAQVESGHLCPMTMTNASVAALAHAPDLANDWLPRIRSRKYDSSQQPPSPRRPGSPSAWA